MKSNKNELLKAIIEVEQLVEEINKNQDWKWENLQITSCADGAVSFYLTKKREKKIDFNMDGTIYGKEVEWEYKEGYYRPDFDTYYFRSSEEGTCYFDQAGYQVNGNWKYEVFNC